MNTGIQDSHNLGWKLARDDRDETASLRAGDRAPDATKLMPVDGETLVLIRPDGYIGLISDAGDAAALADYLAAIG
jgi:hypothetical protein